MQKKRVITGWRQVPVTKPRASRVRPVPAPVAGVPQPGVAKPDPAANERWEAEGGHLAKRAK
jgi:hypothetical protein